MSLDRRTLSRWIQNLALVCALALLASACRAETQTTLRFDPDESATSAPAEEASSSGDAGSNVLSGGGGVDPARARNDVSCTDDSLNDEPTTPFVVAHYVVDGNLGAACFGQPDDRLLRAWEVLAAITPPGQLRDLGLFGGYLSTESGETTLAFVNELDLNGSLYQMSINLAEAERDPDELMLTMAHEFSHVFSQLPTELDRSVSPRDCETYFNGVGCFVRGSLMAEWIDLFWGELIEDINPELPPTGADGEALCRINPSFLGAYAASNPEEDFAESFSAFVFQLPVESTELRAKMAWFAAQPGLVEFQDRAIQAGYGPLTNEFQVCG